MNRWIVVVQYKDGRTFVDRFIDNQKAHERGLEIVQENGAEGVTITLAEISSQFFIP